MKRFLLGVPTLPLVFRPLEVIMLLAEVPWVRLLSIYLPICLSIYVYLSIYLPIYLYHI